MAVDISRLVLEIDSNGVVKASGNLDVFKKRSSETETAATKLGKTTKGMGDNFAAFQVIVGKLPVPLQSIAAGMLGMVSPATAAAGAIVALGVAAIDFAKSSMESFGAYELVQKNLERVMGSADIAAGFFAEAKEYAAQTSFDVPGVTTAITQMRTAGIATSDLMETIKMLGDVSQGNNDVFQRMAFNLIQIKNNGKATMMDLRQFANAGIPILSMLNGVEPTYENILQVLKDMTSEGGKFFNAQGTLADAYVTKVNSLSEAWEDHKATWADTSGLADWWKDVIDGITESIKAQTEAMEDNARSKLVWDNIRSGKSTPEDNAFIENRNLTILQNQLRYLESRGIDSLFQKGTIGYEQDVIEYDTQLNTLRRSIELQKEILAPYQEQIDMMNERKRIEEEWQATLEDSGLEYTKLQGQIEEAYGKTEQGRKEALEAEIELWRERLNATHKVGFDKWGNEAENGIGPDGQKINRISYYKDVGISDSESEQIKAIIDALTESLKKVGENANRVTEPFRDWVKLLSQATGYLEEDIGGKFNEMTEKWEGGWGGLDTVEKYASEGIDAVRDRLLADDGNGGSIYKALGLTRTDVLEDAAGKMRSLVQMMTEARLEGAPWSLDDESYRRVLELLREYEETYENAVNDQTFSDVKLELEKQREFIKLSRTERIKTQFGEENGLEGDRLNESWAEKQKNLGEIEIENLTHQLDLLKMTTAEKEKQLLLDQGMSEEHANQVIDLQNQIEQRQIMNDLLSDLKNMMMNGISDGMVNMFHDLGSALATGADAGDAFDNSFKNMIQNIVSQLGPMFLSAGLQQLILGNIPMGIALMAAGGVSSLVSGMMSGENSIEKANDEMQKLMDIQKQIQDLLDAQREEAEYYAINKRRIDATTVNDMILTPQGNFSTHPDDYIIATKHPETLASGGGSNVSRDQMERER